jgi:replicative DNA helicase
MPRGTDISPLSLLLARIDAAGDDDSTRPESAVASGFPSLDRMLGGGLRRGDLIVLGGAVSSGKSALALAMALRASQEGRRAAFYTGEMSVERVLERTLAIEGRARMDELQRGAIDEATRASVGAAAIRLRDSLPVIDRLPAGGIDALAEELQASPRLDLVIVDPLEMLATGRMTAAEELATAIRRLKALAVDLDCAILLTAHLPGLGPREDPRPTLDDFGALGAVREHADVVLGLFREGMYDATRALEGATELIVRKARHGTTGYVDLYFYAQWMRFEDMLDPDR